MKYFVLFVAFFTTLLMPLTTIAQEKRPQKPITKTDVPQPPPPDIFQIVSAFAKGRRVQSVDAKNVSVTIKPARILFSIEF